eukprot:CAMPEP_0172679472 /NCGR_PEP_ID=MMETSP1074-20121228/16080_1 /TAXON_ID=2916 /ORGANISM="Ceratium fusus, Strain PA161109" /LENGTH=156 /DNA_ID=CAMNT_0013497649 /DNA_START=573 /DNA_END=1044 /DNA_ORIENTATION=-
MAGRVQLAEQVGLLPQQIITLGRMDATVRLELRKGMICRRRPWLKLVKLPGTRHASAYASSKLLPQGPKLNPSEPVSHLANCAKLGLSVQQPPFGLERYPQCACTAMLHVLKLLAKSSHSRATTRAEEGNTSGLESTGWPWPLSLVTLLCDGILAS